MQQAAKEGAFVEFVAGSIAGRGGPAKVDSYADAMRKVGIGVLHPVVGSRSER